VKLAAHAHGAISPKAHKIRNPMIKNMCRIILFKCNRKLIVQIFDLYQRFFVSTNMTFQRKKCSRPQLADGRTVLNRLEMCPAKLLRRFGLAVFQSPKKPTTLGGHLKKKQFRAEIRQSEAV
jgi:hypothetical protein